MSRTGFIQNEMDLKLLVLYIMDRAVAPITFLQLLDLALCDAGVDYFSLTEAVNHLTETEHLSLNGELYSITEKGRRNIEICQSSLPYSVRLRCDENLVKLNDALMRQAQVADRSAAQRGRDLYRPALSGRRGWSSHGAQAHLPLSSPGANAHQ